MNDSSPEAAALAMLGDARKFWRFATGLRRFLRTPSTPEDCRRICRQEL